MKNTTDTLMQLVSSLYGNVNDCTISDVETFIRSHFDELDLSKLHRDLHDNKIFEFFNECMAFINKYHSFPKELLPFELDLQDYILADKIVEKIS